MSFKSGFVAIIGKPNVGKSTLINELIGKKIAITSKKPQTTRHLITGVITNTLYQIIFVDTPGMRKGKDLFDKKVSNLASESLNNVDLIIFMVDEERGISEDHIISTFKGLNKPVFLVINKIDLVNGKADIDKIILSYISDFDYKEVIPVSAKQKKHLEKITELIVPYLEDGPMYYPEEYQTDQTDMMLMSEIIREKILEFTEQEVPHAVAVIIEDISKNKYLKTLDVSAVIVVERNSQKGIMIGNHGDMLKKIGSAARLDLNKTLGVKIHLTLFVRVQKNWKSNLNDIRKLGLGE